MCGIAGIAGGTDPVAVDAALRRMAWSMAHRGPDDEGVEIVARTPLVGLCARRLAIQDCSPLGHQPMRSELTGAWIAFNGELYNVGELRAQLGVRGHAFIGRSDTEVVLRAHDEWGDDFLDHLTGMFAVAVWSADRRRLTIARDRLGIKPLYVRESGGSLIFGSEVRTLLASEFVPVRLSEPGLASFLAMGAVREPNTIIEGVRSLSPGHVLTWADGSASERPYWSLAGAFARTRDKSDRPQAVADIRSTLEESTRQHLVSDVPLGVFLSGGIDSSAMVGLVASVADEPPRTVSAVFPDHELSEESFIRMVQQRYRTDHTEIELDQQAILSEIPGALAAMDQPTHDGINTYVVSRIARAAGLTVVLSGLGGDELFGGYDTFRIVPRLNALRRFVPSALGAVAAPAVLASGRGKDSRTKLASWLRDDKRSSAYELRRELFAPDVRRELSAAGNDVPVELPPVPRDPLNAVSLLELDVYMRNTLLRDSDVMSMAHSLELRVPLLDHRLVELLAGMPGSWKTDRRKPKPLLVDAVADLLPHDVVYRQKMGFVLPFVDWMRGSLRPSIESMLLEPGRGGQVGDALDAAEVKRIWDRFAQGDGWWGRPWALYVAKAWGELHLPR